MFDAFIQQSAARYNVPEPWVRAFIETESSFNPQAYREEPQISDASRGLMQLLLKTARGLGFTGTPDQLFDPETNIDLGTKLIGQLRASYGDDFRRVYSAYNSGRPDLWQTSTQVAKNVARAVANLEKYVTTAVEAIGGGPGGIAGIVILLLLLYWAKRK